MRPHLVTRCRRRPVAMARSLRLVEPFYRLLYGAPLDESSSIAPTATIASPRGWCWSSTASAGWTCAGSPCVTCWRPNDLPYAIQLFPWGHGFGRWHADLTNVANRDAKARLIAETIRRYKAEPARRSRSSWSPSRAARASWSRPSSCWMNSTVERVVLLAPALSPAYDLTARPSRRPPRDGRLLVAARRDHPGGGHAPVRHDRPRQDRRAPGWWAFGSHRSSRSTELQSQQYGKLRQVRWRPRMAATGYFGGHLGPDCPLFLRKYVVPLLAG